MQPVTTTTKQHRNKPLAHGFISVEGLANAIPEVYYFPLSVLIKKKTNLKSSMRAQSGTNIHTQKKSPRCMQAHTCACGPSDRPRTVIRGHAGARHQARAWRAERVSRPRGRGRAGARGAQLCPALGRAPGRVLAVSQVLVQGRQPGGRDPSGPVPGNTWPCGISPGLPREARRGVREQHPRPPPPACVRHSEASPGARSRRAEAILSPHCHRHGPTSTLPGSSPRDTFSRCLGPLVPLPPLSLGVTVPRVACLGRGPCWDLTARWELRDCGSVSPAQSSAAQTQGALPQRSDHQRGESDMPPGYPGGGWRRRQQSE